MLNNSVDHNVYTCVRACEFVQVSSEVRDCSVVVVIRASEMTSVRSREWMYSKPTRMQVRVWLHLHRPHFLHVPRQRQWHNRYHVVVPSKLAQSTCCSLLPESSHLSPGSTDSQPISAPVSRQAHDMWPISTTGLLYKGLASIPKLIGQYCLLYCWPVVKETGNN